MNYYFETLSFYVYMYFLNFFIIIFFKFCYYLYMTKRAQNLEIKVSIYLSIFKIDFTYICLHRKSKNSHPQSLGARQNLLSKGILTENCALFPRFSCFTCSDLIHLRFNNIQIFLITYHTSALLTIQFFLYYLQVYFFYRNFKSCLGCFV